MSRNILRNRETGQAMVIDFERAEIFCQRPVLGVISPNRKRNRALELEGSPAKQPRERCSAFTREMNRAALELRTPLLEFYSSSRGVFCRSAAAFAVIHAVLRESRVRNKVEMPWTHLLPTYLTIHEYQASLSSKSSYLRAVRMKTPPTASHGWVNDP
jgi:hypothetical protein